MTRGWYQGESSEMGAILEPCQEAAFDLENSSGLLGSSVFVDLYRSDNCCITGLNQTVTKIEEVLDQMEMCNIYIFKILLPEYYFIRCYISR